MKQPPVRYVVVVREIGTAFSLGFKAATVNSKFAGYDPRRHREMLDLQKWLSKEFSTLVVRCDDTIVGCESLVVSADNREAIWSLVEHVQRTVIYKGRV